MSSEHIENPHRPSGANSLQQIYVSADYLKPLATDPETIKKLTEGVVQHVAATKKKK